MCFPLASSRCDRYFYHEKRFDMDARRFFTDHEEDEDAKHDDHIAIQDMRELAINAFDDYLNTMISILDRNLNEVFDIVQ